MSDTASQSSSELEELVFDTDGRRVAFTLDEELYPRDAILGAAYLFLDRCFVFLERPADQLVQVRLKTKDGAGDPDVLEALAGEFANALLDQVVRFRVSESTDSCGNTRLLERFSPRLRSPASTSCSPGLDDEELEEDDLSRGPLGAGRGRRHDAVVQPLSTMWVPCNRQLRPTVNWPPGRSRSTTTRSRCLVPTRRPIFPI